MVLPTLDSYLTMKKLTNPIDNNNTISKSIRPNSTQSKWLSPISGILNDDALRNEQEKEDKRKHLQQRRNHLIEVYQEEKNKYQNELTSTRKSSLDLFQPDSSQMIIDQNSFEDFTLDNLQQDDRQTNRDIRIVQLKIILQQQMNEIKKTEQELELFKQEQQSLLNEQNQLDQYQQQRKQFEKSSIQQDSSRQLLRQHKAKLHKRAKEIQEQLEFDIKSLQSIIYPNEQTHSRLFEEQDRFRRDLLKLLKQFEQEIKLEKEKDIEFDNLYQEEAAKQWSFQEHQWNHQIEIREQLIEQLLNQRQEEILNRLENLKEQMKEIYLKQQTLIDDMEQARQYQLIEKQKQINERQENKQISIVQQQQHQTMEDHYDEQTQKPSIPDRIVESKFYGRRRVNWN